MKKLFDLESLCDDQWPDEPNLEFGSDLLSFSELQAKIAYDAINRSNQTVYNGMIDSLVSEYWLSKVALNAQSRILRKIAANKLTEPELLTEMGMWVKPELTKLVTDQELLAKIAVEAKDIDVRETAINCLSDPTLKSVAEKANPEISVDVENQELLAEITINATDEERQVFALNKIVNQSLLAKVALEAHKLEFRTAAAKKVTDQNLLEEILDETNDYSIQILALEKIEKQSLFAQILLEEVDYFSRRIWYIAADKLTDPELLAEMGMWVKPELTKLVTDQELLYKLVVESVNYEVKQEAFSNLNDNKLLFKIATGMKGDKFKESFIAKPFNQLSGFEDSNDKHKIQRKSVQRLSDQGLLACLVLASEDDFVKDLALNKILDQELLAEISLKASSNCFRIKAVNKLTDPKLVSDVGVWVNPELTKLVTDQKLLAKIAHEAQEADVRKCAVELLTDQKLLGEIAIKDQDKDVRKSAVELLTDQELLVKIAFNDRVSWVRKSAIEKIDDQSLLKKIIFGETTLKVGEVEWLGALDNITEQKQLGEYLWQIKSPEGRFCIVCRLTDQQLLAKVAIEEDFDFVRVCAVTKLTDPELLAEMGMWVNPEFTKLVMDQELLAKIAIEARDINVRLTAINKIDDEEVLARVLNFEEDDYVWRSALKKMHDCELLVDLVFGSHFNKCEKSKFSRPYNIPDESCIPDDDPISDYQAEYGYFPHYDNDVSASFDCSCETPESIIECDRDTRCKIQIITKINHMDLLERIVLEHPNVDIRKEALNKIKRYSSTRCWTDPICFDVL